MDFDEISWRNGAWPKEQQIKLNFDGDLDHCLDQGSDHVPDPGIILKDTFNCYCNSHRRPTIKREDPRQRSALSRVLTS